VHARFLIKAHLTISDGNTERNGSKRQWPADNHKALACQDLDALRASLQLGQDLRSGKAATRSLAGECHN
jgi:hypothetical protein